MTCESEVFSRPNDSLAIEDVLKLGKGITNKDFSFAAAYCLKHAESSKVYIGSTHNLCNRIRDHRGRLSRHKHPNNKIQQAFDQDATFHIAYVKCDSKEEAVDIEQILLNEFNRLSSDSLLNIAKDARLPIKGLKMSEETKIKMSNSHKEQSLDPNFRSAVKERMKRLWETKEGREKYMNCVGERPEPIVLNGVEYSDPKEAAKLFNCHRVTVQRWAKKQKSGSTKIYSPKI